MADTTPTTGTGALNQNVDYGKTTLFRFSLVKKPEITQAKNSIPSYSDPRGSSAARFFSEGEGDSQLLETVADIVDLNEKLFSFSEWLAVNNIDIDFEEVRLRLTDVNELNADQERLIWDSLFHHYRAVNPDNISKNLVALIRGNAFLKAFNELLTENPEITDFPNTDEKERFVNISRGLIVIPEEQIPEIEPPVLPTTSLFSPDQQAALKKKQLAAVSAFREKSLTIIADKFKDAQIEYETEKNEAFNAAVAEHNKKVEQLLENRDLIEELSEKPAREIEGLELPEFNFTFPPFDTNYIKSKDCYNGVGEAIEDFATNHDFCGKIEKVESYLNKNIDDAKNTFNANLGLDIPKLIPFNEHQIVYDPSPVNNSFVVQAIKLLPNHSKLSLVFTHYSKNGATKIGKISGFIIPDGGSSIEITSSKKIRETEEYTSFVVAENSIEPSDDEFALNGTAFAENGELEQQFTVTLKTDFYVYGPQPVAAPSALLRASDEDGIPGSDKQPMYGIKKIGILDYYRVEQKICCYVPGEVSHIENIMAREFRKKLVRDLERQEITTEESEEREDEKTTDTTTTDRYEMHKEISQMLSKEQSKQIGITAGMNASYNTGMVQLGVNAGTNINISNSSSQTNGFNQAETLAKEVTQKATERLLRKVSYKRTAKMLREHEATNEHGFDNRNGKDHVVGIYRWVDKIYKNTVFNYGKRLQYDFMLPEPAKNFKYWMAKNSTIPPTQPEPPIYPGVLADKGTGLNWKDITEDNYAKIAAEYGADVEPLPDKILVFGKSFSESPQNKMADNWDETVGGFQYELEIPEGYKCNIIRGQYSHSIAYGDSKKWGTEAVVQIDDRKLNFKTRGKGKNDPWFMSFENDNLQQPNKFTFKKIAINKNIPIAVTVFNVGGFSLNVVAECELTTDAENQWKQRTYTAIMAAYQKKLQAYKDTLLAYNNSLDALNAESQKQIDYNYNPGIGRIIEARELKRLCIELMCYQFNPKLEFSREGYIDDTGCNKSNSYVLKLNSDLNEHARLVNFLEQAFEWNLISYQFFPYMYANRRLWESLIKQKSTSDPLFEAFLQSGMARLTLTVTPGFEKQVMFFLDKGTVPVSDDFVPGGSENWYKSIAEDLIVKTEAEQLAEKDINKRPKSWETRVPTDLVILQSDAAPLNQKGLPCTTECKPNQTDWLANGESEMTGALTIDRSLITEIKEAIIQIASVINCGGGSTGGSGGSSSSGGSFVFPRSADLSSSDIGKLVVNAGDGLASVPELSPALPPQTGLFKIRFADIANLQDSSTITIENKTMGTSYSADRVMWRNGNTPTTVYEELDLIKTHFSIPVLLTYLSFSIVDDELIIEETDFQNIRIELDNFPKNSLVIVNVSRPESQAAFTGYPLGKLLAVQGSNAVISNNTIETYTLESPFTVNQSLFASDAMLDFETAEGLENILNHIVIPAENGKVKPLGLSVSVFNDDFLNIYRDQFVGIAIASTDTTVTVAKMPYLSLIFHAGRRAASKGLLFNN